MTISPNPRLTGCFTQNKYIFGLTLREMERRLGYRGGRLSKGAYIYKASELPDLGGFDLYGYNQRPMDLLQTGGKHDMDKLRQTHGDLDIFKLKKMAKQHWSLSGPDSLVKLVPVIPHSDDEKYPPGPGIPQWNITTPVLAHLVIFLEKPGDRYSLL